MAGRGRQTSSFTPEQMQAHGFSSFGKPKESIPTGPPPIYPPLYLKPARLKSNADMDYKLAWKDEFLTYLRESPYYMFETRPRKQIEKPNFNYRLFPSVLQPHPAKAQKHPLEQSRVSLPPRKKQNVDVTERLKVLEQKEMKQEVKVKNEPESDAEDEDFEEDMEMDDENDYDNNYFDNGEDYNEEDDNLDDGPIY